MSLNDNNNLKQQSKLRNKQFWIPVILSIPVTLICAFVTISAADFGFGSFLPAKILFPYMMLTVLIYGEVIWPFNLLMFLQMPLYGIIIGIGRIKRKSRFALGLLLLLHFLAVSLAITLVRYGGETVDWMQP